MADEPKKENEVQPTAESVEPTDHIVLTQGWIVGKRLAAMRGKA